VLDASPGAFESGFTPQGQTREHALLVRSLGVQTLIVAVNKLDTVNWSEGRFNEITTQMTQFLSQVGYAGDNIRFVPCSGLSGENVVSHSYNKQLSWFSGSSLLQSLELLEIPSRSIDLPLRLSIMDISKGSRANVLNITGRLESGVMQLDDSIISEPGGNKGIVISLSSDRSSSFCVAGDVVTVGIHGIDQTSLRIGDIVCQAESPISVCSIFTARVITFETARPIIQGSSVIVHRGRIDEPATIKRIISLIDKADGHIIKKQPRHIPVGGAAIVQIALANKRGIPLEQFSINRDTGRIILRSEGVTVAAGVVICLD